MDARDLGFDAVLYAIAAGVAGLALAGVLVAVVASRLGGRRVSPVAIGLGLVVALATVVDAVVIWRAATGEVTGWDLLWAVILTLGGAWSVRGLAARPQQSAAGG